MLRRLAPFFSVGAYVVLDDAFTYSGARQAFVDFFQIEWEATLSADSECWTTSMDHATDGYKKYRIILKHRAMAQVLDDIGSLPKCPGLHKT